MLEIISNLPSSKKDLTTSSNVRKTINIWLFKDHKMVPKFTVLPKLARPTNNSELMRVHQDQRITWFIHTVERCLMWQKRGKKMEPRSFNGIITVGKINYSTCVIQRTSHLHHRNWIDSGKVNYFFNFENSNRII